MTEYHDVVFKIRALLDEAGAEYKTFEHEAVRTSEEAAALRPEYSLSQGTKALLIRIKDRENQKRFVQVVVPGDQKFDPKKVRHELDVKDTRFATPEEVAEITNGVLPGGVPPFGNLFGLPVYVDEQCTEHDEVIFNAGDKRYSIAMKVKDYLPIVNPTIVSIV